MRVLISSGTCATAERRPARLSGGVRAVARTILVALAALTIVLQATSTAAAEEATYSAIRTVPVPPASNFKTGG